MHVAYDGTNLTQAMLAIITDKPRTLSMGFAARERVVQKFSFKAFTDQLDSACESLIRRS